MREEIQKVHKYTCGGDDDTGGCARLLGNNSKKEKKETRKGYKIGDQEQETKTKK